MNSSLLQILVLAGIAAFLIYRLANVLGRRDGFEPSRRPAPRQEGAAPIDITPERDDDILDHVASGSPAEQALMQMKQRESSFAVNEFLQGARGAYEMILMGFEAGRLDELRPFL
ncbi:MAG: Tim44/TimA family putative adaptor protein, partial [Rhodobacteraceae bacterium]|nr:Tim44/TimA family putative adaptor protein [Paracoccaceae bacterium]